jgi:hypothetical protein
MKNIINIKKAIEIIKSGKFFSAEYIKKDGSVRTIRARSGVKKYLRPNAKPQSYNPKELGYATVFDLQEKDYRLINLQTLIRVNKKIVSTNQK